MSRPEVSVVMPFAGDLEAAAAAAAALRSLDTRAGDELILVDNEGTAGEPDGIAVVAALGERSPAHARNAGAARARNEWILFLDADTSPARGLLDSYFEREIAADVGAVTGEVVPAPDADTFAARYGAARNFLGAQAHLEHPYRPRAAAANLLVRGAAFAEVGGFYEGVRAGEDADFSWRLQQAGWRLELRPEARVEHRYRTTVGELRRQWRGYAAGRAWLGRRYEGFAPRPAVARAAGRGRARLIRRLGGRRARPPAPARAAPQLDAGLLERGSYLALDALLSIEELAGLTLSNRPAGHDRPRARTADVVLVADRFPAHGDPLVELAGTLERVRVEAGRRPDAPDVEAARRLNVDYQEDDGAASRLVAAVLLVMRHPLRVARDFGRRSPADPRLAVVAPAVRRLGRDRHARVLALGGEQAQATARRIARLAGRQAGELPADARRGPGRMLHARRH